MEGKEDPHIVINNTIYAGCFIQLGSQQMMIHEDRRQVDFMFDKSGQLIARPVINWYSGKDANWEIIPEVKDRYDRF